jgi:protein involved in polysaccharide export with SLBB domain
MKLNPAHPYACPAAALGALLVVLAGPGGCTTYTDYAAFIKDPKPVVTTTDYRLAPPDLIQITSKVVREADGHNEQIRPDGKITMPLVGAIFVAGLTCEEASATLEKRYKEFYRDADISLRVVGFNSKKIYVFGQVNVPGPYQYNGANTILGTLAAAQPNFLSDPAAIDVLRPNRDGKLVKRMTIDLDDMVKKGDTSLDAVLEEGDIIYVPPNILATLGLALQQLLLPIQPAAATAKGPADIYSAGQSGLYGGPQR